MGILPYVFLEMLEWIKAYVFVFPIHTDSALSARTFLSDYPA